MSGYFYDLFYGSRHAAIATAYLFLAHIYYIQTKL